MEQFGINDRSHRVCQVGTKFFMLSSIDLITSPSQLPVPETLPSKAVCFLGRKHDLARPCASMLNSTTLA
jgi:hypothetical protein